MKPTTHLSRPHFRSTDEQSTARPRFPLTDYAFQGSTEKLYSKSGPATASNSSFSQSFRDLSKDFLDLETKRTYAAELFYFGIIVALSAWPIVSMFAAIGKWIK